MYKQDHKTKKDLKFPSRGVKEGLTSWACLSPDVVGSDSDCAEDTVGGACLSSVTDALQVASSSDPHVESVVEDLSSSAKAPLRLLLELKKTHTHTEKKIVHINNLCHRHYNYLSLYLKCSKKNLKNYIVIDSVSQLYTHLSECRWKEKTLYHCTSTPFEVHLVNHWQKLSSCALQKCPSMSSIMPCKHHSKKKKRNGLIKQTHI